MLRPAILYKDEILSKFYEHFYTEEMLLASGSLENWVPNIEPFENDATFSYAILNSKEELIGFVNYHVDWYSSIAYNFGLISFDKGNPTIGKEMFNLLEELLYKYHLHKIEWKMISGNPVERSYDRFCKKHNGNKIIITDTFKDREGNYRSSIIYEVFNKEE